MQLAFVREGMISNFLGKKRVVFLFKTDSGFWAMATVH